MKKVGLTCAVKNSRTRRSALGQLARREQRGGLERRGRERMISVFIAARSVMWCPDPSC